LRLRLDDRERLGIGVGERLRISDRRLLGSDDDGWLRWFQRRRRLGRWLRLGLDGRERFRVGFGERLGIGDWRQIGDRGRLRLTIGHRQRFRTNIRHWLRE
jgi:hypothetical protein